MDGRRCCRPPGRRWPRYSAPGWNRSASLMTRAVWPSRTRPAPVPASDTRRSTESSAMTRATPPPGPAAVPAAPPAAVLRQRRPPGRAGSGRRGAPAGPPAGRGIRRARTRTPGRRPPPPGPARGRRADQVNRPAGARRRPSAPELPGSAAPPIGGPRRRPRPSVASTWLTIPSSPAAISPQRTGAAANGPRAVIGHGRMRPIRITAATASEPARRPAGSTGARCSRIEVTMSCPTARREPRAMRRTIARMSSTPTVPSSRLNQPRIRP